MTPAFVALGGNLGDVVSHFRTALSGLNRDGCRLMATSRLYRSTAWVAPEATGPGPDYWNAASLIHTDLGPEALLSRLQALEAAAGRVRGEVRWAARPLDLDLLLYGDAVLSTQSLQVPHPELTKRPFVLLPLADLDPNRRIPRANATVADLLAQHPQPCPGVWLAHDQTWADGLAESGDRGPS